MCLAIVESWLRYLRSLVRVLLRDLRDATAYKHRPSNASAYLTNQMSNRGSGFDPHRPYQSNRWKTCQLIRALLRVPYLYRFSSMKHRVLDPLHAPNQLRAVSVGTPDRQFRPRPRFGTRDAILARINGLNYRPGRAATFAKFTERWKT
jgi:hypothetical protein